MKRHWVMDVSSAGMALAGLVFAAPADAQDCAAPRYVTGVAMTPTDSNTMMLPVAINGVPKMMMLDTGGVVSELTRATLAEFNLSETHSPIQLFDIRGSASRTRTRVDTLSLGGLDFAGLPFQVNADPVFGSSFAGLISNDLLAAYDVDIDFGSNRLNLFSPGSCGGDAVYWPARPVAIVPFTLSGAHITLPVRLDGHLMSAVLDTGAAITTLSLDAAEQNFDLTPDSPDLKASEQFAAGNPSQKIYNHKFSLMTFDGVNVINPVVMIVPEHLNGPAGNFRRRRARMPDLIIGMEILRTLHLYIAYSERKLYITRADHDAASLLPAVAPPPVALAQAAP